MKKLFLGMACFIGLMFFASCSQEIIDDLLAQKPEAEFVSEAGYISSNTSFYVGEELNFLVRVAPNSGSESPLVDFDFTVTDLTGATCYYDNPGLDDPNGENYFEYSLTPNYASTFVVTATVTDEAGKVNIAEVVVNYVESVTQGIGTFAGVITLNGHITSNEISGYQTYDQDMDPEELATTITLGTIDEDNRVSATLDIDGTPVSIYGTLEEDGVTVTFDEFHFNKTIGLFVDVNLDLVMDLTGVIEDDMFTLEGTAVGQGKTQVLIDFLEVNYDGNISGNLEIVE